MSIRKRYMSPKQSGTKEASSDFKFPLFNSEGVVETSELDFETAASLIPLIEQTSAYFDLSWEFVMLPVSALVNIRARPEGILNANRLMLAAYQGRGGHRGPISVRLMADKRWLVLDGNSTTINAAFSGWSTLPCRLEK